ncbi:MAG: NTP transferase domain-containing protein [Bacteroidales bacterium]|nr:NTP transferase domain-containing protein [Bacteroidales bacterium]
MHTKNKPTALILAAGNSGRMGKPKVFLPYDEHRTFLDKMLSVFFSFGCGEVWVVLNENGMERAAKENFYKNVHLVLNEHPEKERFYSLQTGLKAIPEHTPVFVHNGDNPFVDAEVLDALWNAHSEHAVTLPEFQNQGGHPILLSCEIVQELVRETNETQHLNDFLKKYDQNRMPVNSKGILVNINTAEDYQKYFGKVLK